jgi:hypothetical protein
MAKCLELRKLLKVLRTIFKNVSENYPTLVTLFMILAKSLKSQSKLEKAVLTQIKTEYVFDNFLVIRFYLLQSV